MTPIEALEQAQTLFRTGNYIIEDHAWARMRERRVSMKDIRTAILQASNCSKGYQGRWLIEGADNEGDSLTIVVSIKENLIIITVRE